VSAESSVTEGGSSVEPIVISIDIDRAPADVFAYATDPTRFPEWQRDVARVKMQGSPLVAGSRFTTTRHFGGAAQTLVQEVAEVDPPRRWVSRAISGAVRANGALTFEPLDGGSRTRVRFEIDYQAGGLGKVILPLVIRQTKSAAPASFQMLKERLETRSADVA
jgi:uncharacterized protein YndB with AHSA1/START domain